MNILTNQQGKFSLSHQADSDYDRRDEIALTLALFQEIVFRTLHFNL